MDSYIFEIITNTNYIKKNNLFTELDLVRVKSAHQTITKLALDNIPFLKS